MRFIARLVLLAVGLSLAVPPSASRASQSHFQPLTRADRVAAFTASRMAAHDQSRAFSWLRHQPLVRRVTLGLDHQTIEIWFRDGASVVLLPQVTTRLRGATRLPAPAARPHSHVAAGASGRAVVLEPFADQLSSDPASSGKQIVDLLTKSGFSVDALRNDQVTVPVMEKLADYSVVYIQTHSGTLDNGHALVLLGETNIHPYTDLVKECSTETPPLCSVMQGIGQGTNRLSVAITDLFVQKHIGTFSDSSIFYLNGCDIMAAPAFVSRLHQRNVSSVVSWDGKADSATTELSANWFFSDMAKGSTIDDSLRDVSANGFGTSLWNNKVAYLQQHGYGADTLPQALAGSAPVVTATVTPTATATPTAVPTVKPTAKPTVKKCPKNSAKKGGKCVCKKGYTMKKGKCVKKAKAHR